MNNIDEDIKIVENPSKMELTKIIREIKYSSLFMTEAEYWKAKYYGDI